MPVTGYGPTSCMWPAIGSRLAPGGCPTRSQSLLVVQSERRLQAPSPGGSSTSGFDTPQQDSATPVSGGTSADARGGSMCSAVDGSVFEEATSASEAAPAGGWRDGELQARQLSV